jgi:hypothetical protein
MALPTYEDRACTIRGGYCVGAVVETFDPKSLHLKVGPGVFKLRPDMEEFVFPGGEFDLPADTLEVWMMRDRETKQAVVGVRVAACGYVDDESYELVERIIHLGEGGWRVVTWIPDRADWQRQGQAKIPDPTALAEAKLGKGVAPDLVVFKDVPAHVQRAIELRQSAELARDLDYLLERATWTDEDVKAMVQGLAHRLREIEALVFPNR